MMLTLRGLPPDIEISKIRSYIRERCSVDRFLLDELQAEAGGTRRVTVATTCDEDAVTLRRALSGERLGVYIVRVEPYRPPDATGNRERDPVDNGRYGRRTIDGSAGIEGKSSHSFSDLGGPGGDDGTSVNSFDVFEQHSQKNVSGFWGRWENTKSAAGGVGDESFSGHRGNIGTGRCDLEVPEVNKRRDGSVFSGHGVNNERSSGRFGGFGGSHKGDDGSLGRLAEDSGTNYEYLGGSGDNRSGLGKRNRGDDSGIISKRMRDSERDLDSGNGVIFERRNRENTYRSREGYPHSSNEDGTSRDGDALGAYNQLNSFREGRGFGGPDEMRDGYTHGKRRESRKIAPWKHQNQLEESCQSIEMKESSSERDHSREREYSVRTGRMQQQERAPESEQKKSGEESGLTSGQVPPWLVERMKLAIQGSRERSLSPAREGSPPRVSVRDFGRAEFAHRPVDSDHRDRCDRSPIPSFGDAQLSAEDQHFPPTIEPFTVHGAPQIPIPINPLQQIGLGLQQLQPLFQPSIQLMGVLPQFNQPVQAVGMQPQFNHPIQAIGLQPQFNQPIQVVRTQPQFNQPIQVVGMQPQFDQSIRTVGIKPPFIQPIQVAGTQPQYSQQIKHFEKSENKTGPAKSNALVDLQPAGNQSLLPTTSQFREAGRQPQPTLNATAKPGKNDPYMNKKSESIYDHYSSNILENMVDFQKIKPINRKKAISFGLMMKHLIGKRLRELTNGDPLNKDLVSIYRKAYPPSTDEEAINGVCKQLSLSENPIPYKGIIAESKKRVQISIWMEYASTIIASDVLKRNNSEHKKYEAELSVSEVQHRTRKWVQERLMNLLPTDTSEIVSSQSLIALYRRAYPTETDSELVQGVIKQLLQEMLKHDEDGTVTKTDPWSKLIATAAVTLSSQTVYLRSLSYAEEQELTQSQTKLLLTVRRIIRGRVERILKRDNIRPSSVDQIFIAYRKDFPWRSDAEFVLAIVQRQDYYDSKNTQGSKSNSEVEKSEGSKTNSGILKPDAYWRVEPTYAASRKRAAAAGATPAKGQPAIVKHERISASKLAAWSETCMHRVTDQAMFGRILDRHQRKALCTEELQKMRIAKAMVRARLETILAKEGDAVRVQYDLMRLYRYFHPVAQDEQLKATVIRRAKELEPPVSSNNKRKTVKEKNPQEVVDLTMDPDVEEPKKAVPDLSLSYASTVVAAEVFVKHKAEYLKRKAQLSIEEVQHRVRSVVEGRLKELVKEDTNDIVSTQALVKLYRGTHPQDTDAELLQGVFKLMLEETVTKGENKATCERDSKDVKPIILIAPRDPSGSIDLTTDTIRDEPKLTSNENEDNGVTTAEIKDTNTNEIEDDATTTEIEGTNSKEITDNDVNTAEIEDTNTDDIEGNVDVPYGDIEIDPDDLEDY